jgi:hypothetical protein
MRGILLCDKINMKHEVCKYTGVNLSIVCVCEFRIFRIMFLITFLEFLSYKQEFKISGCIRLRYYTIYLWWICDAIGSIISGFGMVP